MSLPRVSVLRDAGNLPVSAVVMSESGIFFKTDSGWSSSSGISLTGEDMAGFFVPAGENESSRLLSELATTLLESFAKPATPSSVRPSDSRAENPIDRSRPLFSGMSKARIHGVIAQGLNLANLAQMKPQPKKQTPAFPTWPDRIEFSPEQMAAARKKVADEDREARTNSKGEVVPVVFPSND